MYGGCIVYGVWYIPSCKKKPIDAYWTLPAGALDHQYLILKAADGKAEASIQMSFPNERYPITYALIFHQSIVQFEKTALY